MALDNKIVHLFADQKEDLWNNRNDFDLFFIDAGAPFPPKEHLYHIKKNGGEKIVCINLKNEILGWIGIIPKGNEAELAGIEVNRNYRNIGIASSLMNHAEKYLLDKNIKRFTFQTCPLLTANSLLYMRSCNTTYKYHPDVRVGKEDSIPWPVVDCIMNLPISRKTIKMDALEEISSVSIIKWNGLEANIDYVMLKKESTYKYMILPFLDIKMILKEMYKDNNDFLFKTNEVFLELESRGFSFWHFDKIQNQYIFIFEKSIR